MFPEQTDYDEAARFLLRQGGGPFVTWLLAEPAEGHRFIAWLDSVLTLPGTKERLCDAVARLEKPDGRPMALLAESQTYPDSSMFGRLCIAGGILWETVRPSDLPDDRYGLMALVLNLTGTGNSGRTFRGASSLWDVSPCEWNLANEDAEKRLAEVEAGSAPLEALAFIPLMKKGGDDGIIRRWLEVVGKETDRRRRGGLKLVVVFAGLTGCKQEWQKALEGFDVNESTIVNEWRAEARREGELKGAAAAVLRCLRTRFGAVPEDVTRSVNACSDLVQLETLLDSALVAASLEDFRRLSNL
jgi:hypothetical protein